MSGHVGDDAELYPLGLLDDDDARELERHIDGCTICAERVAQAQQTAASLSAALPAALPSAALAQRLHDSLGATLQPDRSSISPPAAPSRVVASASAPPTFGLPTLTRLPGLALAAALVLAFVGLGWQTIRLQGNLMADDVALVTLVHSHFNHVSMTPQSPKPVAAKILYARDGSWIYIIADEPGGALQASASFAGGSADLGMLRASGRSATLLVHPRDRPRSITLRRDSAVVATATLAY